MKTTLLFTMALNIALGAFAQGTLFVANDTTDVFRAPIYGLEPDNIYNRLTGQSSLGLPSGSTVYSGALLQGTGFTFAVYYGPASVIDPDALLLFVTTTFRTAGGSGLPAGLINPLGNVPLPGIRAGEQARLQVRVWDNVDGTIPSYDHAFYKGESEVFMSAPLGGTTSDGSVPTPFMTGWSSFNLYYVPETSPLIFASLAGLLVSFRRWKR